MAVHALRVPGLEDYEGQDALVHRLFLAMKKLDVATLERAARGTGRGRRAGPGGCGGDEGIRTPDPLRAKQVLSR